MEMAGHIENLSEWHPHMATSRVAAFLSFPFRLKPPLGHFISIPFAVIISFGHVLIHFHSPPPLSFSFHFPAFFNFQVNLFLQRTVPHSSKVTESSGDSPAPLTS